MSGSAARLQAIAAVTNYTPISEPLNFAETPTSELFGENVFSPAVMKRRLPKDVYKSVMKTIEQGKRLDPSVADIVASAMKDWAIEKGATHYAHVFYPLTGLTAEKHDSFLSLDDAGGALEEFTGIALIQGEPDASSFPHGGIRATFEARGYTAWDVTSPAYIIENPNGTVLCIPTAFVSFTGEALDKKTPLLRSLQPLDKHAQRILRLFGHKEIARVVPTAGPEQEYFLVDRNFFFARPDLLNAGRTLFGARPPKGQEFEDQYFGTIPERVLAFMLETERELYRLGVPIKTRHNEVAPGQFEIAPIYEHANIATDHQQLVMLVLRRVAQKYGMECLLHEKPFAGVNGSGKHLNYSLANATQGNLLNPGDNPHDNAQFLVFCAAVIRAVHKHSALLRSVVATASNDHRLGANEAPPAIMSIYLGDELADVFERISNGVSPAPNRENGVLTVGVDTLPPLPMHGGDRNRTSPFAFVGNRFEFRAVGASQSIAGPLVALNTMVAESLDYVATRLEQMTEGNPDKLNSAVQSLIKEIMEEHSAVIFHGNGYSDEWHEEAARRGLPNLKTAVDAIPVLGSEEALSLFEKYDVLTRRELESRLDIYLEQYSKSINVEATLVHEIGFTRIYPAAMRYLGELAAACAATRNAGIEPDTTLVSRVSELTRKLREGLDTLAYQMENVPSDNLQEEADYFCNTIIPQMNTVRACADELEGIVADDLWPLPKYQEMLFIK